MRSCNRGASRVKRRGRRDTTPYGPGDSAACTREKHNESILLPVVTSRNTSLQEFRPVGSRSRRSRGRKAKTDAWIFAAIMRTSATCHWPYPLGTDRRGFRAIERWPLTLGGEYGNLPAKQAVSCVAGYPGNGQVVDPAETTYVPVHMASGPDTVIGQPTKKGNP